MSIGSLALAFVVAAIVIALGAEILGQVRSTQTADTYEYNVTSEGLEGAEVFGEWLEA